MPDLCWFRSYSAVGKHIWRSACPAPVVPIRQAIFPGSPAISLAEALRHPVTITQRNKPRLVLLNIDDYERLMRQSDARSVGTLETMPSELLNEFEAAVDAYAGTDETKPMSSYDDIQTATVIRYPCLWARQARKARQRGKRIGQSPSA